MALTIIEKNSLITAMRESEGDGRLGIVQLIKAGLDMLQNEAGIDTAICVDQTYTAATDSYDTKAEVTIDKMEYANDAAAQAVYISSDLAVFANTAIDSGTIHSDGFDDFITWYTHDNNTASLGWNCLTSIIGSYIKIAYPYGHSKAIRRVGLYTDGVHGGDYEIEHSDDDSTWTVAVASWTPSGGIGWNDQLVDAGSHRFWRLSLVNAPADAINITEMRWQTEHLQVGTDTLNAREGTYCLNAFATAGECAAETITADLSGASPDLTGADYAYVWVRASRTGANFKIGLTNDATGVPVTTESTVTIAAVNTWERVLIDFSAVVDGDKDDIDALVITILDDTTDNDIYIDEFVAAGEMKIYSKAYTPTVAPTTIDALILEEDVGSPVANTDFLFYVSRDGGTTWTQGTLVSEGLANFSPNGTPTNLNVYSASVDVSGQPTGTDIRWYVLSQNGERMKLHGAALSWV